MILLYLVARNAGLANEFRGLHVPQIAVGSWSAMAGAIPSQWWSKR
jgi:hypothetical protein